MRLAGTWKQYSRKAINQLTPMAAHIARSLYFKWPYQAKVMKMLEMIRRKAVFISPISTRAAAEDHRCGAGDRKRPGSGPGSRNAQMALRLDVDFVVVVRK